MRVIWINSPQRCAWGEEREKERENRKTTPGERERERERNLVAQNIRKILKAEV